MYSGEEKIELMIAADCLAQHDRCEQRIELDVMFCVSVNVRVD